MPTVSAVACGGPTHQLRKFTDVLLARAVSGTRKPRQRLELQVPDLLLYDDYRKTRTTKNLHLGWWNPSNELIASLVATHKRLRKLELQCVGSVGPLSSAVRSPRILLSGCAAVTRYGCAQGLF